MATTTPPSTVSPTSTSKSTCVYRRLTASVSLVMRLTSAPVGAVEERHRQAQHVVVDGLPQPLHRAQRKAGEPDELGVAQHRRCGAGGDVAANQERQHGPVERSGQQVGVDELLAQERAGGLEQPRDRKPERRGADLTAVGRAARQSSANASRRSAGPARRRSSASSSAALTARPPHIR